MVGCAGAMCGGFVRTVAVLVTNLVTQLPELVRFAAIKALDVNLLTLTLQEGVSNHGDEWGRERVDVADEHLLQRACNLRR